VGETLNIMKLYELIKAKKAGLIRPTTSNPHPAASPPRADSISNDGSPAIKGQPDTNQE
jgi:hypothetical protein